MGQELHQYPLRITKDQKNRLESLAKESGFGSIRDYILHCVFNQIEYRNMENSSSENDGNIKYILENFAKYLKDFEQTIARVFHETNKDNKAFSLQIDSLLQGVFLNTALLLILFTNFIRDIYCQNEEQKKHFLEVLEVSKKETRDAMKKRGIIKSE